MSEHQVIPDAAIEAAARADYGDGWDRASEWERSAYLDHSKLILEAAASHMLGYKWPVGDDDNPHRDGDVQPQAHWIVNRDAGWGCSGCDWTGATLKEYWHAHGRPDEYKIPF